VLDDEFHQAWHASEAGVQFVKLGLHQVEPAAQVCYAVCVYGQRKSLRAQLMMESRYSGVGAASRFPS